MVDVVSVTGNVSTSASVVVDGVPKVTVYQTGAQSAHVYIGGDRRSRDNPLVLWGDVADLTILATELLRQLNELAKETAA